MKLIQGHSMYKVSSPSKFPEGTRINHFHGKQNYEQAIKSAEEWEKLHPTQVELVCYFEQRAWKRSILVAYKRLDVQDDNS